ncbi:MAG: putative bifunctional diguanylate cyclase/phosphodiesterase [Acidimicrobiales bacterium]
MRSNPQPPRQNFAFRSTQPRSTQPGSTQPGSTQPDAGQPGSSAFGSTTFGSPGGVPLGGPRSLAELTRQMDSALPSGSALLDELPMAVVVCNLAGLIMGRSAGYARLFEDPAPHQICHLRDLFDERSRALLPDAIASAFASAAAGRDGVAELQVTCQQPGGLPLACSVMVRLSLPREDPDDAEDTNPAHLVAVIRPLGETGRQMERQRAAITRFDTLLRHLPVGVIGSSSGLRADYVNASCAEIFGVGAELLLGLGWLQQVHPDDAERAADAVQDALSLRRPTFVPLRVCRPEGDIRFVHLRASAVGVADDLGFVASVEDMTGVRQLGDAVNYQARHDLLTGLLNRSTVEGVLEEVLEQHAATGRHTMPALLFVDLDDFGDINESIGYHVGDGVLTVMADRLYAFTDDGGAVARFGGDEFVVILSDLTSSAAAHAAATRLVEALSRPFQLNGQDIHCTASIGVAWLDRAELTGLTGPAGPDTAGTAGTVEHAGADFAGPDPAGDQRSAAASATYLQRADLALHQAKRSGKNRAALASGELLAAEHHRLRLARSLRQAIDRDRLDVYFQPIVDLGADRIAGLEALVRWHDPELGRISPDVFIPAAETHGLIAELGRNVLRRALAEVREWRRLPGCGRLYVSVNMSAHELDDPSVANRLAQALAHADLPADALYVELTESALLRRESTALERLDAIRRLGIGLAIDDFGTGYSSLARLRRLPVDVIKIDREFVRDLGADRQAGAMLTAVAALAAAIGLAAVAEGIETDMQLAELRRAGIGFGQGYLFSEPIPASRVPDLLARSSLRHAA